MQNLYKEGNKVLVMGKVCEDVKSIEKDGQKKAIIKLEDKNGEKLSVFFANRPDGPQLADRVMNANIAKDTVITVLAYVDDGKDVGTGLDFKFRKGVWTFKTDKGEINVLFSTICGQKEISDTMVSIRMPLSIYNPETKAREDIWGSVAFYDAQDDPEGKKAYAQRAKKAVFTLDPDTGEYKKYVGAVVCGGLTKKAAPNGGSYYNYSGWRVELP